MEMLHCAAGALLLPPLPPLPLLLPATAATALTLSTTCFCCCQVTDGPIDQPKTVADVRKEPYGLPQK